MITREHLLKISDLRLSESIDSMSDIQLAEFCRTLDGFTEKAPQYDADLKRLFETRDLDSFSRLLLTIRINLISICADDLAQDCLKLINDVRTAKVEKVGAFLSYFLTELSMLSIDIQMAQYNSETQAQANIKAAANSNANKSILAVDDSSLSLNWLKSALQDTPYKFTGAISGAIALKYIKEHRPDLFILDIEMPVMDGYELARKLREYGQTAPIIYLTGNSTKEYLMKAIQAGASDFLVKPINKEHVINKISKLIN